MPSTKRKNPVVDIIRRDPPTATHRVGRLAGWSESHGPLVDYEGNLRGPLPARSVVALNELQTRVAMKHGHEVLLAFDLHQTPVIVGWLQDTPGISPPLAEPEGPTLEANIDGKRIVLQADQEIVLRCGRASITLRRNGRIVIDGTSVEAASEGVMRVKGGSVQIN